MPLLLSDLLDERHVILGMRSRKPANAIREIVRMFALTGKIGKPEAFLEQVIARERMHPSIVENGVAFPHVRTDLVDEIVVGTGRSRAGISFGDDQSRAHLIFVIGVPERLIGDYLICVGTLARLVKDETVRSTLLNAATPREFIDGLVAETL
jgi:mannitol/fructose-specific phosphotransferase system IIA component (Ntr-type)